jgi:hypothetical protein
VAKPEGTTKKRTYTWNDDNYRYHTGRGEQCPVLGFWEIGDEFSGAIGCRKCSYSQNDYQVLQQASEKGEVLPALKQ